MSNPPELHPMNLAELLDAAIRSFRGRFFTLVGGAVLLQMPLALAQLLIQMLRAGLGNIVLLGFVTSPLTLAFAPMLTLSLDPNQLIMQASPLFSLCALQYFFVQPLIDGALINLLGQTPQSRPIGFFSPYLLGWRRTLSLIPAALPALVLGGLGAWIIAPLGGWLVLDMTYLSGSRLVGMLSLADIARRPGVLWRLLVGLLLLAGYGRLALAPHAVVLESQRPSDALRRSWQLVGHAPWRSTLVIFINGLLTSFLVMLPFRALILMQQSLGPEYARLPGFFPALISIILSFFVVVHPLQVTISTLLYDDLRMRRDGYDLELLAQQQV